MDVRQILTKYQHRVLLSIEEVFFLANILIFSMQTLLKIHQDRDSQRYFRDLRHQGSRLLWAALQRRRGMITDDVLNEAADLILHQHMHAFELYCLEESE